MMRMMAGVAAAALAALLAACATVPAAPPSSSRLSFIDLTARFAEAYDAAPADPARRLAAIDAAFSSELPGFYDPARFGDGAGFYRGMADAYLATYPGDRAAIAEVSRRFDSMFEPAVADFERRVGSLPRTTPVRLVVSMGEFDGATRTLGGRDYLLFGADMIGKIHHGEARAFVQHELFHVYHGPRVGECDGIWCTLWSEGLAVHAAQVLNPAASDGELLLTIPEPIRPALEAHRAKAVCTTLAKLDSREGSDWGGFFSNGRIDPDLPPRFGYLVGAWVAADLGRTRSLAELADLRGPPLRAAIESSLRTMATCP